jgi:hypothetical protein
MVRAEGHKRRGVRQVLVDKSGPLSPLQPNLYSDNLVEQEIELTPIVSQNLTRGGGPAETEGSPIEALPVD